ncbi:MAG: single-stranded-DNA-specific exonuclease RecJ [Chromatiales bacterium]|jgi:single-stranded-DNA-specific exonuclease|nr:single-stranded-DNA-specific exonuclease RecJ [Chromatiales bacterium]
MTEWKISCRGASGAEALRDLDPLLARIYAGRGIEATDSLDLGLRQMLPVRELKGTGKAVERLTEHMQRDSRILIVGDFDADGATSTALVCKALRNLGHQNVDFLVPNRFDFGYGLTPQLVAVAIDSRPDLIITVDNGISSIAGSAAAREAGIDVIVTDHHLPPQELPDAVAIVNPNLDDETFPSKNLAGVGVAFYLMAALAGRHAPPDKARALVADLLDLVAVGTVADLVPLDRNNRILVEQGLRRIRARKCCTGIIALMEQAGRDPRRAVAADLGFYVGPRLNAAGRLDDISVGIRCLLADDPSAAREAADLLGGLNQERREIEQRMQDQATTAVDALALDDSGNLPAVLCLFDPDWHQGVVGLVASRIKEKVHRPVVAFAADGPDRVKGSARSIPGLHIRDVLAEVDSRNPELIERFGGHAMAAGLSLSRADLGRFRSCLSQVVEDHLDPLALTREILTDGSLDDAQLSLETAELLRQAGPWGQGFPEPLFVDDFRIHDCRVMKERHLRFRLSRLEGSREISAVAFNQADRVAGQRPTCLRLVYRLEVNEYRGVRSPQLIAQHIELL